MTRTLVALLTTVGLLAALTGCGSLASSGAPAASADPLPEIRMEGLDPCALVTPEVLSQAGVKSPHEIAGPWPGIRICSAGRDILQHPSGSVGVFVATNQDVRNVLFVEGSQVTTVAGFGAVEIPDERVGARFACDVRVDVAPNQGLWVDYLNDLADEPGATHELMCQRAHTAAETIMRDLLARTK
jgi:hypothetical protein